MIHPEYLSSCGHTDDPASSQADDHSLLVADWVPLDELTQLFSEMGQEATTSQAMQAVSSAFAALAFETSAHKHYTLAYHGLWGHHADVTMQGVQQALTDLIESRAKWGQVALWLDRLANEERVLGDPLEQIRLAFHAVQKHQQHAWQLSLRLQKEVDGFSVRSVPVVVHPLSVQEKGDQRK